MSQRGLGLPGLPLTVMKPSRRLQTATASVPTEARPEFTSAGRACGSPRGRWGGKLGQSQGRLQLDQTDQSPWDLLGRPRHLCPFTQIREPQPLAENFTTEPEASTGVREQSSPRPKK